MVAIKEGIYVTFFVCSCKCDLEDLLRASAEVLGRGSREMSYKAVLEEGMKVVVKRLKGVTAERKEFEAVVEKLGKLDHDNVVALRLYHYSTDVKILVFDYVPAESLSALLHGMLLLTIIAAA